MASPKKPVIRLPEIVLITLEAERALKAELRAMIFPNLNTWNQQCNQAAEQALTEFETKGGSNPDVLFWATVGNLVWASAVFVPESMLLGAILSFGGVAIGAIAGLPSNPTKLNIKGEIQKRLAQFQQHVMIKAEDIVNEAVEEIIQIRRLHSTSSEDAQKRRYALWDVMFDVPFGAYNIQTMEKKAVLKALNIYDALYGKWDLQMYDRAVKLAGPPRAIGGSMAPYNKMIEVMEEKIKQENPFGKWVVNQPEVKNVKEYYRKILPSVVSR